MKWILSTMLVCFLCLTTHAQNKMEIAVLVGTRSYVVIKKDTIIIDSLLRTKKIEKLNYLIPSDSVVCFITEEIGGSIDYYKYSWSIQFEDWVMVSFYNLGYYPLQSLYLPNMPHKPDFNLVAEDSIESTVDSITTIVNLAELGKRRSGGKVVTPRH